MTGLAERVRAAILARKELAEAVRFPDGTPGTEWTAYPHPPGPFDRHQDQSVIGVGTAGRDRDSEWGVCEVGQWDGALAVGGHIAANDPSTVIRHCTVDLRRLDAHTGFDFPANQDDGPGDYAWTPHCTECWQPAPCSTVRDLAEAYGITEEA